MNFTGAIALMTYTDSDPNSTAAGFTASVSWGDGSPATLGTIVKSGATYTVSGIHTYPEHTTGTPYTLRVTVTSLAGSTATHTSAITVTDAALSGPTAFPFQAAEGQQLSNIPLGTFLDGNPLATAADFAVSINWGDGTTSDPGFATLVGGSASNAKFAVSGSHVYASAAGSPYAVTVSVTDSGGATTTINTAATVTQTPLSVYARPINAVAATPTSSQVIATFFDAGGNDPVGNYSAFVSWGDGTSNTLPDVSISAVSGQPGLFTVTVPAHTYATPGLYPISVSVVDSGTTSGSGNGFALVAAASLTASDGIPIADAVEGQPLAPQTQVASFLSGDPTAAITGFSAVIDWGDGTPSTIGTITQPGGVGTTFLVSGGHTYLRGAEGGYSVTVRVTDAFNNSSVAITPVTSVADAPLTTGTPLPVSSVVHQPLVSIPVGTFVDTNPFATATDFTATIEWGDDSGIDSNAEVVLVGGGGSGTIFAVYGTHTYDAAGSYSIVVNVADQDGSTLTITPGSENANVMQSALSVTALPQTATEATAILSGTAVGTFLDLAGADPVGNYSASLDWGDGSAPDTSVVITALGGSAFRVDTGNGHTYATPGTYALKLTVVNGTSTGLGGNIATVADAPLTTTGGIASASVTEGARVNFTGAIALMTFTDGNPNSTAAEFTATISWGDGSPSSLGTIVKSGATYTVSGIHTYPEHTSGTPYTLSVDVADLNGSTAAHTTSITVTDAALSGPTGFPIWAGEGQQLSNIALGTFLDGNPLASAADFAVSINWGDGTTSDPGFATLVGGSASNAKFAVGGSHVYASAAGSPYAVTVSVTDSGGATTTINTAATVTQTPLSVSVLSINAVAATPTASQVIATFFDAGGADPVGNYSATVHWGDGTSDDTSEAVTITAVPGQPGLFNVNAPAHTYARPGLYPTTVTVDDSGTTSGSGNGLAVVAAASLTVFDGNPITGAVEGQPLPGSTQVARFLSGDPTAAVAGFSAVIDWGDGTPSTIGTITQPGGVGTAFLVDGGHTYAHETAGGYTVTVRVTDAFNNASVATTQITSVADAPLSSPTAFPFQAAEGQQLSNIPLGTFLDGNPLATAADFTVSIDWGDGTPADTGFATLVGGTASNAKFAVSGSHVYTSVTDLHYMVTITVTDSGGETTTIDTTASITLTPLSVSVLSISAVAATPTPDQTVGVFFDAGGADPVENYQAFVDWGDGQSTPATIDPMFMTDGMYSISAPTHTYAKPGIYPITVYVADTFAIFGIGNGSAVVTAASLTASTAGAIGATEGQPIPVATQVASFTSGDPTASASDFAAVIDWGDGTPSTVGTITQPDGVGTDFIVSGGHTYAHAGPNGYTITVRVTDAYNNTSIATSRVPSVLDAPLTTGKSLPVSAAEHVPLYSVPVATFVDANPNATEADFVAAIDWGDVSGIDTNMQVVRIGGTAAGAIFAVYGSHTYESPGSFATMVLVNDIGGQSLTIAPESTNVTVAQSTLSVAVLPQTATAGTAIPAETVIGTFSDALGVDTVGQYSASIDWGDGSPVDKSVEIISLGGTSFRVSSSVGHTYADPGSYALKLTISESPSSAIGGNLVAVKPAAPILPVLSPGSRIDTIEGTRFTGAIVATFTDSSPGATTSGFVATIDWGDDTLPSVGTIVPGNGSGNFVVQGSHTYAEEGSFVIRTSVVDTDGNRDQTNTLAIVLDAPLSGASGVAVTTAEAAPLVNVPLGSFVDGNRAASAADFLATIDWGDDTAPSTGNVVLVGGSAPERALASSATTPTPGRARSPRPSPSMIRAGRARRSLPRRRSWPRGSRPPRPCRSRRRKGSPPSPARSSRPSITATTWPRSATSRRRSTGAIARRPSKAASGLVPRATACSPRRIRMPNQAATSSTLRSATWTTRPGEP